MAVFLKRLFFLLTDCLEVQRALQERQYIPQLMEKLSESRNMTLLIVRLLLQYMV